MLITLGDITVNQRLSTNQQYPYFTGFSFRMWFLTRSWLNGGRHSCFLYGMTETSRTPFSERSSLWWQTLFGCSGDPAASLFDRLLHRLSFTDAFFFLFHCFIYNAFFFLILLFLLFCSIIVFLCVAWNILIDRFKVPVLCYLQVHIFTVGVFFFFFFK